MRMLDLFSGIGGFALAAEWVCGDELDITGFCEIEKYAQKVLQKNFPGVPIYDDITKLNGKDFKNIDLITGGFPCQDISIAGKGAGIKEGTRSGLWFEMWRIISEVRPRFALIENVPMLTIRGGTRVIADLAKIGYNVEWQIIGASDVGAWHKRKRIWIVAYSNSIVSNTDNTGNRTSKCGIDRDRKEKTQNKQRKSWIEFGRHSKVVSNTNSDGQLRRQAQIDFRQSDNISPIYKKTILSDTDGKRRSRGSNNETNRCSTNINRKKAEILQTNRKRQNEISDTNKKRLQGKAEIEKLGRKRFTKQNNRNRGSQREYTTKSWWKVEPNVGRVAHGIPSRVDRLKGLGNAIVPQVAALIMERIKNA